VNFGEEKAELKMKKPPLFTQRRLSPLLHHMLNRGMQRRD